MQCQLAQENACCEEDMRALKNELLLVLEQLPESALVGLVTFDSMVRVHDLGFPECSRVVVFHGERERQLSADQRTVKVKVSSWLSMLKTLPTGVRGPGIQVRNGFAPQEWIFKMGVSLGD
ncbi:protein transport protein sec23-like [Rhodamnia argentea]|uniref:Protein transport protein SEC23 n=1 Tax=Rhodamnia argentea TaxID=178133 RepID=A0ABM3H836_9MYRT|nr:protein transport protein sec23-like [Rhodamnia argentea]